MTMDIPYFMEDESWYSYDYDKRKYVLTDKAPKDAIKSYESFYREVNSLYQKEEKT